MKAITIIPARLAASRLPGKPLADIGGLPMILHVARRAVRADVGPVFIAAGDAEIADVAIAAGYKAVLTHPDLPSGSDRVRAALAQIDPQMHFDVVVNLQGDMPNFEPELVSACVAGLADSELGVVTAASPGSPEDNENPNVVKVIMTQRGPERPARAHYFTRSKLFGEGPIWRHIGIYCYKRNVLEEFGKIPPSELEVRESLEQLRIIEAGYSIGVVKSDRYPNSVDTPEDLAKVRAMSI